MLDERNPAVYLTENELLPEFKADFNSYPQSWYPICLSRALKPNQIVVKKALVENGFYFVMRAIK